jgi:hypothetical protein
MMNTDRYTKAVLTVIALCLVWMSVGGPALLPVVGAQPGVAIGATDIVIVGWRDARGEIVKLPALLPAPPTTFSRAEEREISERARALGARLPVATQ